MKKLMAVLLALGFFASVSLVAQDTSSSASQDSMKAPTSTKASSVTGKISEDGKTFVSDKDGKSWSISNPDAVKGHEGHHVTLKARVDADKSSVDVVSLKMAGGDSSTSTSPK
jgi:hypothetical protein